MRAMMLVRSIVIMLCLVLPTTTAQEALSADEINEIEASLGQNKRQHPPGFSPVDPDLVPPIPGLCPENGYDKVSADCTGSQKYRTFDGSCNNLFHVNWGKAIGPLARFLDPDYGDGKSSPRRASDGSELPNPRLISSTVTIKQSPVSDSFTALVMSFGQFLDHDFALSPESLVVCPDCVKIGECDPIPIYDDYFFYEETECLHFTRSRRVKPANCAEFPKEQQNIVSSYIDLSMVYGSTQEAVDSLRDLNSDLGLLRSVPNPLYPTRKEYLPFDDNNTMCAEDGDIKCGLAGDFRAPEQVGLTSLHTMFLREHNRVARELASINPHWDGERLYQETRRILIAMWQNIVFKEYIHLLIGTVRANAYDLFPRSQGRMRNHYDPTNDVTILNEFSTACFRMGHSMIPPSFTRLDKFYNVAFDTLELNFAFFNATHMFDFDQGGMDSISLGLTASPLMRVDHFFSTKITNQLFADPAEGPGSDLVAINIQRGRDHGIPGYTAVLKKCSTVEIESFDDLQPFMSDDVIGKFKDLYNEPTEAPDDNNFGQFPYFPPRPKPTVINKRVQCSNTFKIPIVNLNKWKEN
ncbi:peroxidasin-like [Anneissia japonica]|uniref:peroxidasin-like n=1 Tax=Anneissia japonica TaxID=1529436 RepID=UPI00142568AB|nr:peroxidasin-like [Anneissia japonica]